MPLERPGGRRYAGEDSEARDTTHTHTHTQTHPADQGYREIGNGHKRYRSNKLVATVRWQRWAGSFRLISTDLHTL